MRKILLGMAMDVLFWVSLAILGLVTRPILSNVDNWVVSIIFAVLYFAIVLLVYSFFKIWMWKLLFKVKKNLKELYIYNCFLFLIFGFILLISYVLLRVLIADEYIRYYSFIWTVLMLAAGYMVFNILQINKLENGRLIKGIVILKENFMKYVLIIVVEFIVLGLVYGIYALVAGLLGKIADRIFQALAFGLIIFFFSLNRMIFSGKIKEFWPNKHDKTKKKHEKS